MGGNATKGITRSDDQDVVIENIHLRLSPLRFFAVF
jgi:hypothetical protein